MSKNSIFINAFTQGSNSWIS